jgi:hypothetical protein
LATLPRLLTFHNTSVDTLGKPLRFRLTARQRHGITQAEALIIDLESEHVIADRSYNSDNNVNTTQLMC